jgi:hypothetical protein
MAEDNFSARASFVGYVVLAGIWFVIGGFFAWLEFARQGSSAWQGSLVGFAVGILWAIWLRGFRLSIDNNVLTYRDGMYRTQSGSISRITAVRSAWVEWKRLPRKIRVPRLVIEFDGARSITINPKPFARSAFAAFRQRVTGKLSVRQS